MEGFLSYFHPLQFIFFHMHEQDKNKYPYFFGFKLYHVLPYGVE
jgi:hypothetical protein